MIDIRFSKDGLQELKRWGIMAKRNDYLKWGELSEVLLHSINQCIVDNDVERVCLLCGGGLKVVDLGDSYVVKCRYCGEEV